MRSVEDDTNTGEYPTFTGAQISTVKNAIHVSERRSIDEIIARTDMHHMEVRSIVWVMARHGQVRGSSKLGWILT